MTDQTFKKPSFRRELRLGLVVYGGVSLAVYMNGVCREFYNAVRGRGAYKLIKALTDSDIIVDIISGTSAGGINGVLLSYALTNSTADQVADFANLAQIWRESGNILGLMRQPSPSDSQLDSILDGEGYYQKQLKEAFDKAQNSKAPAPTDEWLSEFNELDLFVTGTDVFGRVYKVFDDTGRVIEIKDHKGMFQLKHRQGRKEPFNPGSTSNPVKVTSEELHQALAKLCRITSCFPVAFPVVDVQLKEKNPVDQKLVEWGLLEKRELPEKRPEGGYNLYFVDGGVLDNRPFSYTIKEMYYRTANRPVDRKLFYIDPGPDRFTDSGNQQYTAMPKPNTLQVIQDSLEVIQSYESIGNDLQLIKEHNEKVRRYRSILKDAEVIAASKEETRQENQIQEGVYLRSRLISLRDRILPLVLRMEEDTKSNIDKQAILEKTATLLTERVIGNKEAESSEKILQAFGEQIRNLDIAYSLRKHFYIIAKVCQLLDNNQNRDEYKSVQTLAKNLSRQIKILEVTQSALDMMLSYPAVSKSFYELLDQEKLPNLLRGQFYERLLRLHRFLLDAEGLKQFLPSEADKSHLQEVPADFFQTLPSKGLESYPDDWVSQKRVSGIFDQLKAKISKLSNPVELEQIWNAKDFSYDKKENEEGFVNILRQVELATESLIKGSQITNWQKVLSQFTNFRELDQILYPFEYLTDITEKELIHTVRISPNDAQMGFGKNKKAKDKLAGETLYAFGGFFKKSWRSNDILWGRLDGLNRIVEALITTESVQRFPEFLKRQAREQNCQENGEEFEVFKEKYIEFLVKESLPNSQPLDRLKIIDYLRKLANPTQFTTEQLQNLLKDFLDDLVREGHREILSTDLQNVIADEIDEQLNWNRQRVDLTKPNQKPKYLPVAGYFDRSVSALAAGTLAKEAIEDLVRTPGGTEDYFLKTYKVGEESVLDSVPTVVLANLSTRFGLILRNVVLTTLGDRSKRLRRSVIYNVLDKSLQLFYWWLQLTAPLALQTPDFLLKRPLVVALQVVLLLLAILGIAITVSKSLTWVLIALGSTVLCWFLGTPWRKNKSK